LYASATSGGKLASCSGAKPGAAPPAPLPPPPNDMSETRLKKSVIN
jgi:hypothetical protein